MTDILLLSLMISLCFLILVIYLVIKRKLKEQYSIIWLFFGLVIIVLCAFPSILEQVSGLLNVYYAPSLLFMLGIIFALLLILNLTIVISRLSERVIKLTQTVSILQNRLDQKGKNGENQHDC